MKVYVLLINNSDSNDEYCGVYSTKEKAQKRLNEIIDDCPSTINRLIIEETDI